MRPSFLRPLAALAAVLASTASLAAQSYTWSGGPANTPSDWSHPLNWQFSLAPVSAASTQLTFSLVSGPGTPANNNLGTFTLNRLQFSNLIGTFETSGAPLIFAANGGTNPTLANETDYPGTVGQNLSFTAPLTMADNGYGQITIDGTLTSANASALTIARLFPTLPTVIVTGAVSLSDLTVTRGFVTLAAGGTISGAFSASGEEAIVVLGDSGNPGTVLTLGGSGSVAVTSGAQLRLAGGTVNYESAATLALQGSLTLSAGVLQSSQSSLTIDVETVSGDSAFYWTGGAISGTSGQTATLNGNVSMGDNASKQVRRAITSTGLVSATGGTIDFGGSGSWLVNGANAAFYLYDVTVVTAESGSNTFSLANGASLQRDGSSSLDFPLPFDQGGGTSIRIANGGLRFTGGGNWNGDFDVSTGGTLEFGGGAQVFAGGNQWTGTGGVIAFSAGTFSSPAAMAVGNTVVAVNVSGGAFRTPFVFTGTAFNWSGGDFSNVSPSGVVDSTVNTDESVALAATANLVRHNLTFNGNGSWVGAADLQLSGSTVTFAGTNTIHSLYNNAAIISSDGTSAVRVAPASRLLKVFSSGTSTIGAGFSTSGYLEVDSGRLLLSGGSAGLASDGAFIVGQNGLLEFGGGTHRMNGASWAGAGEINLSAGVLQNDSTAPIGNASVLFDLTGGTLTGGNFDLAGSAVVWTAGTLTTTFAAPFVAATTVNAPFYIAGPAAKLLDRRSVNFPNGGWSGGDIQLSGSATTATSLNMVGPSGAIFSVQSDQSMTAGANPNVQFTLSNFGNRLIKDTTSGTTTIAIPFSSVGSVEINSGRLLLSGGTGTFGDAGLFQTGAAGVLEFGGGTHQLGGVTWAGNGRFALSAGSLVNNTSASVGSGGAIFDLSGGALSGGSFNVIGSTVNWSGATLTTSAAAPFVAGTAVGGAFTITGAAMKLMDRRSVNFQSGTWTGGDIQLSGSSTTATSLNLNGAAGSIFRIQSDQSVLAGANPNVLMTVFASGNRLIKDTTAGTTTIAIPFASAGNVEVNTGRLLLSGGSGNSASGGGLFQTQPGAILEFGGGTHQLNGSSWAGTGRFVLSAGSLISNSTASIGSGGAVFDLSGGTLSGVNFNLVGSSVNWTGTALTTSIVAPGVAATVVGGVFNIIGAATKVMDRRSVNFQGGTWSGGDLQISGSATTTTSLNLNGAAGSIFRIQSDQSVLAGANANVLMTIFTSGNRLIKDTTAGTTTIAVPFASVGNVEVNTGRLLLSGGSGNSASGGGLFQTQTGAVLEFGGGTHLLNGSSWTGTGRFVLSAGTLVSNSTASIGSAGAVFDLTGGTLSGVNFNLFGSSVNWTGTALTTSIAAPGVAATVIGGTFNISGAATKVMDRRSVNFQGGTWTGGDIQISGSTTSTTSLNLNGAAGSIFRIQSDQSVLAGGNSNVLMTVFASGNRLIKDTTTGTTNIAIPFASVGNVEVNTGRLLLAGGSGSSASGGGLFQTQTSAVLEFGGGTHQLNGSSWAGSGSFVLSAGTLVSNSTASIGSGSAVFDLTGGTLSGVSFNLFGSSVNWGGTILTTTLANPGVAATTIGGPFTITGPAIHRMDRRSVNFSSGTWTGGDIQLNGSTTTTTSLNLNGPNGSIFRIQSDQRVTAGANGNALLTVFAAGNRMIKDTTTGITSIQVCFSNAGSTEVSSGTLLFTTSCNTNAGLLTAHAGGTLRIDGQFGGNGNIAIDSGGTFILAGAVSGGGQFNIAGTLDLRGGFLGNGSNSTTINAGGRLTGNGTIAGAFTNNGTVSTTGGISFTGPVTNNGVMRFRGGGSLLFFGPAFVNNGVLDVITGSFSNFGGGAFVNNGVVLDSTAVKVKRTTRSGNVVSLVVDGYDEHVFQLQYSPDLQTAFADLGTPQAGLGGELTFTDSSNGAKEFYRVVVNP